MPRGPMGGRRAVEEPHDFGKVMGKLVNYCRNYLPVIIIALILGAAGTVCQIVGPDKLKDMTNEIVKGLPAIVNGRPVMNSVDFGTVATSPGLWWPCTWATPCSATCKAG